MIVIIPYTTVAGGSTHPDPVRGSVHKGRRVTGAGGDLGAQNTKAAEEESGWKGRGAKKRGGPMNQPVSLLLCKCLQRLLGQEEAPDWWAGLNCKVHFSLVAAARLWTVTQGSGGR